MLKGRKALVTGGGINIGHHIALNLARMGADVALLYRSSRKGAEATGNDISDLGRETLLLQGDVSSSEDVSRIFSVVEEKWGKLDILVNNAGIFSSYFQDELPPEEWDRIFGVNMKGLFLCCRDAIPLLKKSEAPAIVNLASINGFHPGFGMTAHYDASKGGVIAYTRSLAAETATFGIRVNGVAPGLVDSEGLRENAPELVEEVRTRTPMGRLTTGEDVADTVGFLASSMSGQITGQIIVVDGGYLLS